MAVSAVKKEAARPAAEADAPAPPPKKRAFNWKLPLIVLCVIGAAAGGAYWYMNRHSDDAGREVKAEAVKPPQFLPLDPFTVNLQLEENPQYLQIGLTLKVADNAAVDALKLHMPEVRNNILLLLSGQKASTLLTLDGKRKLAADIVASLNAIIAPAQADAAPATTAPAQAAPASEAAAKTAAASDAKPAAETDVKPADTDAKPATGTDAKPAAEADAKPAVESGDTPAAAPAPPVLSVLFTSFIVQ
jgi:flagellar FliL protein